MGDNQRQVIRNEEELVEGEAPQTVTSQTTVGAGNNLGYTPANTATTVQASTTTPGDKVVQRNYAESVIDPAGEKADSVDWFSRIVWFVVGIMSVLLLLRFGLLAAGADENAG